MKTRRILSVAVVLLLLVAAVGIGSAQTRTLEVSVAQETGKPVPVSIKLDDIRRTVGIAFIIDWNSLRVYDADGNLLPFQIDDADLSGNISRDDLLVFSTTGPARIEVERVATEPLPTFDNAFVVEETEDGWRIESVDGNVAVVVTKLGSVDLVRYNGIDRTFAKDIGFLRYAGYPMSTYWVDGQLKNHEEKTTLEEPMRVRNITILGDSPVRATVVVQRASDLFPGLRQDLVIGVYPTGEVQVDQVVTSAGYADMTKLHGIVNAMLQGAPDGRHILPVFRWLEWADELGVTPAEYWRERGVLTEVDGAEYVTFQDISGPAPLWWGASYIFASPERWRTNHSEALGLGMAEMLMDVPAVPTDLRERLESSMWVLEGEWRTGYFRWIPEEVIKARTDQGIELEFGYDMEAYDWPLHLIPGDTVTFANYYVPYEAKDLTEAVRYLEARYTELSETTVELK